MMKKYLKLLFLVLLVLTTVNPGQAQEQKKKKDNAEVKVPVFTIVNQVKTTPIKSQGSTGTCWCFATTSMFESELLRMGKGEIGLSEMFTVRTMYSEKTDRYTRMHGNLNLAQGGAQHDVTTAMKLYGMVPREVYPGLNYGESAHKHGELESVIQGYMANLIKNRNGTLSTAWKKGMVGILDAYFGDYPAKFSYQGKQYTPESFEKELGLNPDDYIEFSSYTHHPFYKKFILEVPDNWIQASMYNLPIDDLMEIINNALNNGISISWAADISGLNFNDGVGLIPVEGSDPKNLFAEEKKISQADRQYMFDSYQLTDDHAMHLVGIAKDQNGKKYYIEKNSWGEGGKYKGFSYMSESFMRMRTMSIMVHKDAVPAHIKNKIGL